MDGFFFWPDYKDVIYISGEEYWFGFLSLEEFA